MGLWWLVDLILLCVSYFTDADGAVVKLSK